MKYTCNTSDSTYITLFLLLSSPQNLTFLFQICIAYLVINQSKCIQCKTSAPTPPKKTRSVIRALHPRLKPVDDKVLKNKL